MNSVFSDHSQFGLLFGGRSVRIKDGVHEAGGVGSVRRIAPWPAAL